MSQSTLQQAFERYAKTILRVGLNLQVGQELIIEAPLSAAPFVRVMTEHAYKNGASQVHFEWSDDELNLIRHRYAPETSLGYYPEWKTKGLREHAQNNAAVLFLQMPNPGLLRDIPAERVAKEATGRSAIRRPFLKYTHDNTISWVIANLPSPSWAAKVYPELPEDAALEALWALILRATRTDSDDAVEAWKTHVDSLRARKEQLNSLRISKLHYRAPGTDLTIELPEKHTWLSSAQQNAQGAPFVSNIPTEEVYTMPKRDGVNGVVRSTRPLNFQGTLIEDFSLTFQDGRVVECSASNGEAVLRALLDTDEGSRSLGEVALVPYHSPISMMNRVFYDTLFDENASCHLALGRSFPSNLIGGLSMSPEEMSQNGANMSLIHIDFMMGSSELEIDAELPDGGTVPIFRNGDWVE